MSNLFNVRQAVVSLINKFISPYVDNLNSSDLNLAIMAGDLTLHNLHLKRSAVEKYNLPIEVLEGHVGHLHITIPWFSLRTAPITITVEDVFLLCRMKAESTSAGGTKEDFLKEQEAKQEKLRNAESLDNAAAAGQLTADGAARGTETQTWLGALTQKLVDNVQVTVKNIHLRYEDDRSTPEHPFAAGFTLASFKAVSANEDWVEAFITSATGGVRKLANLDGLSMYFDTDEGSIYAEGAGEEGRAGMMQKFMDLISRSEKPVPHQYILKPVTGEARVILNKHFSATDAKTEAQVFFEEIGFVLDDDQYRDALSMLDLFHFYTRTHQYRRFRPADSFMIESPARARWKFATSAIRNEVHERNEKWTWDYLATRRDNRRAYVELFLKTLPGNKALPGEDLAVMEKLEMDLSYEDIRFFRSVAKAQAKKDAEVRRKLDEEKKRQQGEAQKGTWLGWVWGGKAKSASSTEDDAPAITEADQQQLNDLIDFDPVAASQAADLPGDFLTLKVTAALSKGSLSLRSEPKAANREILSLVFDSFSADVSQMIASLDGTFSLGGFSVFDGTADNTLYPKIVRVKDSAAFSQADGSFAQDPFFVVRVENKPLDGRADNAVTVKMRHLEIIYHRSYIEAVTAFFVPPASQLESMNALLDAAGQTFEGIRQETRAGLEFALEQHKRFDLQVDMNAPIIIVPESVTTARCLHLVLDAGHIAVNSKLADKDQMRQLQSKRGKQFSDSDYEQLETFMYDRFDLRLEATQLLIGMDLKACLEAAESSSGRDAQLHIVERINMSFQVHNAITNAPNLTRLKVSGSLPGLQINLSDAKYKGIMKIIDIAVPSKAEGSPQVPTRPGLPPPNSNVFRSRVNVVEYVLDDDDSRIYADPGDDLEYTNAALPEKDPQQYYEAPDTPTEAQKQDLKQINFEFDFKVGDLKASLLKASSDGSEKLLANAAFHGFGLNFQLKKWNMGVDLYLRALSLHMIDSNLKDGCCISSGNQAASDGDLVRIRYLRVQKESPEYVSVHDGVDQAIDAEVTTINIHVEPEPIISLYAFIMTTFVPEIKDEPQAVKSVEDTASNGRPAPSSDKIRIRAKLTLIQLTLQNGKVEFAALALSAADVALLLRSGTMRLSATLGNLTLTENVLGSPGRNLLDIEGKELADFTYETFDPLDQETFPGYNSFVKLRAGSLRFNFVEDSIRQLSAFGARMAQLKALYDAASEAAIQKASEVTRMRFDVAVKTPIITLPRSTAGSSEVLCIRLGEITTSNDYGSYRSDALKTEATLSGISVSSGTAENIDRGATQMLSDVRIDVSLVQRSGESPLVNESHAEMELDGRSSEIQMSLTQEQYCLLMDLASSLPKALSSSEEGSAGNMAAIQASPSANTQKRRSSVDSKSGTKLLEDPKAITNAQSAPGTNKMKVRFSVPAIRLEVYGPQTLAGPRSQDTSISRFRLGTAYLDLTTRSDESMQAEVSVRSFTMTNTRAGNSVYRELIPEATHGGNQFMLQYIVTGLPDKAALVLVTIDSPQVVLVMDPLFALVDFAVSPFKRKDIPGQKTDDEAQNEETLEPAIDKIESDPGSPLSYRVEVAHSEIMVVQSDSEVNAQAIHLSIKDVVLAQQSKMTLVIHHLGMAFGRMDSPTERVRFLDDIDVTLAMDSAGPGSSQEARIELALQKVIFRASYTNILLLSNIVDKAIALAAAARTHAPEEAKEIEADEADFSEGASRRRRSSITAPRAAAGLSKRSEQRQGSLNRKPVVIVTKETLVASVEGFQLVLIGDLHELPLVHLSTEAFLLSTNDWSGDLKANTTFLTSINYYNMINSYWEPVMDPWDLQIKVAKTLNPGAEATTAVSLVSKRRLEMNLTSAFIEMAITTSTVWSKESDRLIKDGGGTDAPFRLVNKTGYSILAWSDSDRSKTKSFDIKKLADGESIPWRFHDHKRMRENISSSSRNAFGVQIENMPWEKLRNMSVDIEGEVGYTLRPKLQRVSHRLVCDVRLKDNVKIVTLRSSFRIENKTHLPMEMVIVDNSGKPTNNVYKIPPGEDCPLPIEAAMHSRFRLRPDRGFDYNWSLESYAWQDLMRKPIRSIACRHRTPDEAAFRFQAESISDKKDPIAKIYPRLTLRLRAPIEIENLLPYNIRYRVYDKNTRTNTTNFLIKGGSSPIHTVELDHLLLLSVEAQDSGLKQSEFAIINTDNPDDFRTEDVMVVHDRNDVKLNLKLHYFTYPGSGGAFKVQVYSPYVIVNKTGLPFDLTIKNWSGNQKAVAGQDMFADDYRRPEPTPFLFAFPHEERNSRLFLKVGDSEWSRAISVEGVGEDSEVKIASRADEAEYHLGFSYAEGLGKYMLSKVITLAPRYLVKNEGSRPLKIRQYRTQNYRDLKPGRRISWHAFKDNAPEQFCLAWDAPSLHWSAPFNITELGRVHLTLPPVESAGGNVTGHRDLLRIDTRLDGACIFLIISEEEGRWPLRIRNETAQSFLFQQTEDRDSEGLAQDRVLTKLNPYSFSEYSWDSPAATGKRIRLVAEGQEREIDIMEIGSLPPWKFMGSRPRRNTGRTSQTVALDVRADGTSQMLVLSPYIEEESVYKPKIRPETLARSESTDSLSTMAFETVMETSKPTLTLSIDMEGIGLSVVDRRLREIVYASFRGLVFSFSDHPTYRDWNFDCKWIQVDNQLFGGLFPIVLYPSTSPSGGKELDAHPTLQLSAAILKDEDHGVHYIKYATILMQSMTVELDEDFLFALLDFARFENASWKDPARDVLMPNPVDIPEPPATTGGRQIYFEDLLLQPIMVELSFMRTDRVNVDDKLDTSNPVAYFINALTMALGNVNAAPLKLNALIVHNVRLTTEGLQERMIIHYREQIMSQLYRVLGSADFLGNPVGLFNNISSGVADVFYEPYQGMVMHGNKDLGMGLARGVTSLGKKTIFGVTDSMTKVTSSVGKGLAAATLDSEYQARRRAAQRRNKPKHALYGFINGANAFASSVASGVEGLTLKPIEGAQADGVGGFFKGVGKGFVGALTKPVVGVFDFASTVTEGIRNTTSVFDGDIIDRARLPRYTGADGILKPYNEREALGQSWLKNLEDGRYSTEDYIAHLDLPGDDSVVMLTTSRILLIRSTKLRVLWEVSFADLQTISLEPSGLSLVLKGDVGGPFIPLAEQSQRLFLFKHVETVVRKHNEKRKSAEA